jgi:hypothetical protein
VLSQGNSCDPSDLAICEDRAAQLASALAMNGPPFQELAVSRDCELVAPEAAMGSQVMSRLACDKRRRQSLGQTRRRSQVLRCFCGIRHW